VEEKKTRLLGGRCITTISASFPLTRTGLRRAEETSRAIPKEKFQIIASISTITSQSLLTGAATMIARLRNLILEADPAITEEWKGRLRSGLTRTGVCCRRFQASVKMNFFQGAFLEIRRNSSTPA